jgi:hypothetical protein
MRKKAVSIRDSGGRILSDGRRYRAFRAGRGGFELYSGSPGRWNWVGDLRPKGDGEDALVAAAERFLGDDAGRPLELHLV